MEPVRYGPARIVTSGDVERAAAHLPRALALLRQTQERQRAGGLRVLGGQWALDEDSYCYVVLAGGMAAVHVVAGNAVEVSEEAAAPAAAPDFVSGAVRNGYLEEVPATRERPSYQTLRTFHPTAPCADAFGIERGYQAIERLAVEPWTAFDVLRNQSPSGKPVYSQYTQLKPTMYSGSMRKVVQALMGFGRQRRRGNRETSLYDAYLAPSRADPPAKDARRYAIDVGKRGLRIRYDWRFGRTHGVTRSADGSWWLVEISISQGVIAMPLPLHDATTSPAFRDWIEKRTLPIQRQHERANDAAALLLIDEFGGFPTGESFPTGREIDAWIRAGYVVRLAEKSALSAFYAHSAYSSAMGWAFSARGDEAHNTAWTVGDDGYLRGVHHAVTLRLGERTPPPKPAPGSGALAARLETLRKERLDGLDAAIWKCARLVPADVRRGLRARTARDAFDLVDRIVLPPSAEGRASVRQVSEGPLYNPAKTGNLIKFPEPEIGLLLSLDMRVADSPTLEGPRCDTTVHVFFDGNELKWVRYCRDPRLSHARHEDGTEECMFVGSWTTTNWWGGPSIPAALYSSDFDDRTETEGMDSTVTVGRDLGYSMVSVSDDLTRPYLGEAIRTRRFLKKTTTVVMPGERVETGVAVPFGDREAYYYAVWRNRPQVETEIHAFAGLRDPWTCMTWRNYPGYTGQWAGDINTGHWVRLALHPDGCGPVTARTVMSPSPKYQPYACSDYADQGPWCFLCDDVDRMMFAIPEPPVPPPRSEPKDVRSGAVWLVASHAFGQIKTQGLSDGLGVWSLHSPLSDPTTSADQHISETHNVLGRAEVMRYADDINGGLKLVGAPQWPGMESGSLTFVGVIDG